MNKDLIDFILSHSGQLPDNMSWYDIGLKFGIKPPNSRRAKKDPNYIRKSISTRANDIWRNYLKQKGRLELSKEIYENGKLKWETYKKQPLDAGPIDHTKFDIEGITTNPYGGAWFKLKKKNSILIDSSVEELKKLLTKEITPQEYAFDLPTNNKACFIYGSDKHIGALTKENSIYNNQYNREVIKQRLIGGTLSEIETWISNMGTMESLYIMDLGDALDGFNGKTTGGLRGTSSHTLPQQMNNREQHDFYVEVHQELFDIIVSKQYAKDIFFIATSNSNHGGDFEYGAMKHLETYLNLKYPFIKTFINYNPLNHFFYGNHCIIFGHGKDEEDMKHGLPLVLNEKVENYFTDYVRVNKLEDYHITVVTGDLHQSAETYGKAIRYKKVLSQYGSSKWMHTNFGIGKAGLSSEIFYKEVNRIFKSDTFFHIENKSNTGIKFG